MIKEIERYRPDLDHYRDELLRLVAQREVLRMLHPDSCPHTRVYAHRLDMSFVGTVYAWRDAPEQFKRIHKSLSGAHPLWPGETLCMWCKSRPRAT